MTLSTIEGMTYAVMVGFGEAYFLADGVRLGASTLELGLLVALPLFVGAGGPVLALALLARARARKPLVVGSVVLQALLLAGLAVAEHARATTPLMLIALACASQVCGQAAGVGWNSWYGDLVPAAVRGRYFSARGRAVHTVSFLALVGAGLVLGALEPGAAGQVEDGAGGTGYTTLFAIAAAFRLVSAVLLAVSPELRFAGMPRPGEVFRFLRTARGSIAWRVLVGGAVLQLTVYVASPYFGPFMLENLQFTYLEYTVATACVVLMKFVALPLWGRSVDAHGARPVYALAAAAVAIVPLPWLWTSGLLGVALAQMLSGFAWAGYEISFFGLLLSSSYRRMRPVLFATQSLCSGSAQLAGMLCGALLLGVLGRDLRMLFGVSLVARLGVALTAPRWAPAGAPAAGPGRRAVLVQVLGFRAHGGLVHRAVEGSPPAEPRQELVRR